MNKKVTFSKAMYASLFAGAMLFATSSAFAQVKIGTNPTTVDPANNLEVEASTAGRKTSIDKTTGQMIYADGTQGNGKVLTSDANGAASWQSSYQLIVMAKNDATLQPTGTTYNPSIPYFSGDASTWNGATGTFTAPSAGFYQFNYSVEVQGPAGQVFTLYVTPLTIEDGTIRGTGVTWNNRAFTGTKYLNAGEYFNVLLIRSGGVLFDANWKVRRLNVIVFKIQ